MSRPVTIPTRPSPRRCRKADVLGRRSFFKRLVAIATVIALAPEIAFGRKLELPLVQFTLVSETWTAIVENPQACFIIENFST